HMRMLELPTKSTAPLGTEFWRSQASKAAMSAVKRAGSGSGLRESVTGAAWVVKPQAARQIEASSTANQRTSSPASLFRDRDLFHFVALLHGVDDLLRIVNDAAKDRMLAIEPGSGDVGDEELRAVGVGPGIGHREHTRPVVFELLVELIGKRVA